MLGSLLVGGCDEQPTIRRPGANVLLVSLDTLRADHLELYGYERETAPTLARLAAESVVFERALSQAPKTAPSHMTMMTGRYPSAHGVRNLTGEPQQALSESIPLMAGILAQAGYRTAAFTGGGHIGETLGFDRGFARFVARGWAIRRGRRWLENRSVEFPPFFLFLHTYSIHDPYVPPEDFQIFNPPGYEGDIISNRGELARAAGDSWKAQHRLYWDRVDGNSAADLARLEALYDAAILTTDARLRRLLETLESKGLLDTTLLIVVSDHGEEFQDHGGFLHTTLYEENLRVPLLMRFPGRAGPALAGRRIQSTVSLVDLLPTVLDVLGLEGPTDMQGRSLLPFLEEEPEEEDSVVLSEWPGGGARAVQQGRWKLIVGADGEQELYDLIDDPTEQRNLIDRETHHAHRLRRLLSRMMQDNDRLLRQASPGESLELDDEVREQLEALGYLE